VGRRPSGTGCSSRPCGSAGSDTDGEFAADLKDLAVAEIGAAQLQLSGFSSLVTAAGRLVTLWFGVTNRQVASLTDAAVAPLLSMPVGNFDRSHLLPGNRDS
jgi:hypothetical protein